MPVTTLSSVEMWPKDVVITEEIVVRSRLICDLSAEGQ